MAELHFESPETEEYYRRNRRTLGVEHPYEWNRKESITREDVELYIKDAENILDC